MASPRLSLLALRSTQKSTLLIDESGKIIREIEEVSGKISTPGTATTTTTTGIATVAPNLTLRGNTGIVTFNITQTNLSAIGGNNITTAVVDGALVVGLNNQINISQVNLTAIGNADTFTSRDSNNKIQFGVTSTGIPYMEPKSTLPALISGLVYISGSNVVPEGYYLGYTGEPGTTEAERGDLTP